MAQELLYFVLDYQLYLIYSIITFLVISIIFRSGLIFRVLLGLFVLNLATIFVIFNTSRIPDTTSSEPANPINLMLIIQGTISLGVAFLYNSRVSKPLKQLTKKTDRMADGDLTPSAKVVSKGVGETGSLIHSTNVLASHFRSIVLNIKESTIQLANAAEELASGSEEVAATTEEVTGTIQTIAEGAADQVRRLDEVSNILTNMVNVTEDSIRQIGMTANITLDLAEQTNLVSLNAAIEAAKASSQSEGFQVVADHVRSLSIESKSAANSVNQITQEISMRMRDSVDSIVMAVDKIASVAENTAASAEEAAAAAEEQSAALQEITQQAQKLSELSDSTERNIEQFRT